MIINNTFFSISDFNIVEDVVGNNPNEYESLSDLQEIIDREMEIPNNDIDGVELGDEELNGDEEYEEVPVVNRIMTGPAHLLDQYWEEFDRRWYNNESLTIDLAELYGDKYIDEDIARAPSRDEDAVVEVPLPAGSSQELQISQLYESEDDSTRSPPATVNDIHVHLQNVPCQEPPQPQLQRINNYPTEELNLPSCSWHVPVYHNNGQTYGGTNDVYQQPQQPPALYQPQDLMPNETQPLPILSNKRKWSCLSLNYSTNQSRDDDDDVEGKKVARRNGEDDDVICLN